MFPVGVFAGLNRLTALSIDGNHLTSRLLPLGLFSGLNRLDDLSDPRLPSLTLIGTPFLSGSSADTEVGPSCMQGCEQHVTHGSHAGNVQWALRSR